MSNRIGKIGKLAALLGTASICLLFANIPRKQEEQRYTKTVTLGNGTLFCKDVLKKGRDYSRLSLFNVGRKSDLDHLNYEDFNGDGKVDCIKRYDYFMGFFRYSSFKINRNEDYREWREWFDSGDFLLQKELRAAGF